MKVPFDKMEIHRISLSRKLQGFLDEKKREIAFMLKAQGVIETAAIKILQHKPRGPRPVSALLGFWNGDEQIPEYNGMEIDLRVRDTKGVEREFTAEETRKVSQEPEVVAILRRCPAYKVGSKERAERTGLYALQDQMKPRYNVLQTKIRLWVDKMIIDSTRHKQLEVEIERLEQALQVAQ